uniref:ORF3 n=1 Tax=Giant panda anellovirus TaxID=2016460 RepID=A0A220IGL8_9VIRU|nr:ORF3 [Giant panda anellovirus]
MRGLMPASPAPWGGYAPPDPPRTFIFLPLDTEKGREIQITPHPDQMCSRPLHYPRPKADLIENRRAGREYPPPRTPPPLGGAEPPLNPPTSLTPHWLLFQSFICIGCDQSDTSILYIKTTRRMAEFILRHGQSREL